jgi:hypothetical protein
VVFGWLKSKIMKGLIILFLAVTISTNATAQNPEWINYTSLNNYTSAIIFAMATDNDNVWVATDSGLIRINMITGDDTLFTVANSGLPSNIVQCIAVDSNGNKWIGTNEGLVYFDDSNWTVYDTITITIGGFELPMNVKKIVLEPSGEVWCIIRQPNLFSKLYLYDGSGLTVHSSAQERNIYTLSRNPVNGNIWNFYNPSFGLDNRVRKYDGSSWETWDESVYGFGASATVVFDLFGNKWIGTINGNLAKYDDTTWTIINSFPGQYVKSIAVDNSGDLWIGTRYNGLFKYDYTVYTVHDTVSSIIPANDVIHITVDNSNHKWIISSDWTNYHLSVYKEGGVTVAIDEISSQEAPPTLTVFPNPMRSSTLIRYELKKSGIIQLEIYDALGRRVKTLVNEHKNKGIYEITLDPSQLTTGINFCQLTSVNSVQVYKLLVLK